MAHPNHVLFADIPDTLKQGGCFGNFDLCPPELALGGGFDLAAKLCRHRLLAIANAEYGQAHLEQSRHQPGGLFQA